MEFLENDLESVIFNAPRNELLKRGLWHYLPNAHTYRQLRIGNYGKADIVQFRRVSVMENCLIEPKVNTFIEVNVMELKKNQVNQDTLIQALRYCRGILDYISTRSKGSVQFCFQITLIGKTISHSEYAYFSEFLSESSELSINMYTYDFNFDGIRFNKFEGWSYRDTGFGKILNYGDYIKTGRELKFEDTLNYE